jgi:hypothetical protein
MRTVYSLTWFEKNQDDIGGEIPLSSITESDVRKAFDLEDDDPPGDCLEVHLSHLPWLHRITDHKIDMKHFDYFVEASQANPFRKWMKEKERV